MLRGCNRSPYWHSPARTRTRFKSTCERRIRRFTGRSFEVRKPGQGRWNAPPGRVFALEAGNGLAEGFVFEAGVGISAGPKSSLGFSVLGCECSEFCARGGKNLVGNRGAAVGLGVLTARVLTT